MRWFPHYLSGKHLRRCLMWAIVGLLVSLGGQPATAQGDIPKCNSIELCNRLIESGKYKGPGLSLLFLDRGVAHQVAGDHERAIEDFGKAIQLYPALDHAFINRGVSWAARGAYDRAIEDFTQALRINPKNARAYNNRGGAYRDKGDFDRAMADYQRAIALDPKLAEALFNRATIYLERENYDRAIADYSAAIRHRPRDIPALAARGHAFAGKKEDARAKADYEAVLAIPVDDQEGKDIQDAVRQLLQALLEKKASVEKGLPPSVDPTQPVNRIALVIGNGAYGDLGALKNPTNDAEDVAKSLKQLGFSVWLRINLGHAEMKDVLMQFARAARQIDTAIVFFAGHGFQHGSVNYLAPIDADIDDESSLEKHVSLQAVMSEMKTERGFRILIIDACRNNLAVDEAASPTERTPKRVVAKRGFAQVQIGEVWDGGGMLIAFATLPGFEASDGAGRNSPFTQALLRHLPTPGLELRHLFVRVRSDVVVATGARQLPHVSDALKGTYVFRGAR